MKYTPQHYKNNMKENKENKKEVETLKKQIDELGNTAALMAYERLCDLASGIYVLEETQFGTVRRFRKEPNREAAQDILDRSLGKASQEVRGPGEDGAFVFNVIKYDK